MASYSSNGSLTTDKRTVDDTTTWDGQSDWESYQSAEDIEIVNGAVQLAEGAGVPGNGLVHRYDTQEQTSADPLVDQVGSNNLTATNFIPAFTSNGINTYQSIVIPSGGKWFQGDVAPVGPNGQFTIAFVGRWSGSSGFNYGLMNGSTSCYAMNYSDAQGDDYALVAGGGDIRGGTPDSGLYTYVMSYDGTNGYFERGNILQFHSSLSQPSTPSGSLSVGGNYNESTGDELEIGELLFYDGYNGLTAREEIHNYFVNRWDL